MISEENQRHLAVTMRLIETAIGRLEDMQRAIDSDMDDARASGRYEYDEWELSDEEEEDDDIKANVGYAQHSLEQAIDIIMQHKAANKALTDKMNTFTSAELVVTCDLDAGVVV